jgi:murein DD-endopeptidase MepM/ murein hydrolase activator NlpD
MGRSSKKTFFNSPLQYTRISSGFSKNRLHPVYRVRRAHEAVDYAAPTGTPISSVAEGVVVFAGWSGGYGRLITIKHDDVYTTMYAHLSRFATGLKKGDRVSQGDLIGYVGASGTATGPHLDFRMKQNNTFIDPQAVMAKQEGQMLEAAEAQAFSQLVTSARNRLRENLPRPGA